MHRAEARQILGVAPDADLEQVRLAYRQLLHVAHPDRGGDPVIFELLQEAWQTLSTTAVHDGAEHPPRPEQKNPPAAQRQSTADLIKRGLGELSYGCVATILFWLVVDLAVVV